MNDRVAKLVLGLFVLSMPVAVCGQAEAVSEAVQEGVVWEPEQPWEVIDVAIAIDTSNSMAGLIETARLNLWEIVNDLDQAEPQPTLRVALITFGTCNADGDTGWVQVETGFTEDLDLVSERLFASACDSGIEYVGRVLQVALQELQWTPSEDALKVIFVAGNEPADQDPEVDVYEMGDLAWQEGVSVQPIFYGDADHEDAQSWIELAEIARSEFAAIPAKRGAQALETPFDEELAALSAAMNETYVPLGTEGRKHLENRASQDRNALEASQATAAGRAVTKITRAKASWDLVAAVEENEAALYEIDESELPEPIREMSLEERELYVEEKRLERARLQEQIAELGAQRQAFIGERAGEALISSEGLDAVVRRTIREKAEEKGFRFPEP